MRLIHIADLHLGYRAYNRVNSQGLNAREADVFSAFREAMCKTAELVPDLVVIAGDLFHVVRPSNLTIQQTFREFVKFRNQCSAPIVIIGGNHDSPRSADAGCILDLFLNIPDIRVAHSEYVQISLEKLDTSVFCLPHRALPRLSSLRIEADPTSKRNILLAHGTVEGIAHSIYDVYEITRSQVISDSWDYIGFGHYHIFTQLAPNAYYAGSTEHTSTNIWSETEVDKGFIEYDLDERKLLHFHKVTTREVIDLRPIDAEGIAASDLNKMIEQRVAGIQGGHKNKIVRLVIENVHRAVQADLDFAFIRSLRAEALHFDFQLRPPKAASRRAGTGQTAPSRTLEEEWEEFARAYELAPGMDKVRFAQLGRDYLREQLSAGAD